MAIEVFFVLLGIAYIVVVITNVVKYKNPVRTNILLILLIIIGIVYVVTGFWLIAMMSIDAWFYAPTAYYFSFSPFFLGLLMIIIGVSILVIRKMQKK